MRSSYRRIGDFIQLVDERNRELKISKLLGLSISKEFIPSVANIIGTDMSNYKIIRKNQFACSIMQVRRDKKMPVALLKEFDEAIISQAYPVFEVLDINELLPEYLMMWFSRSEFDRQACFHAVGGVRGSLEWEDFLNMEFPIPSIQKQREIVKEYNTIINRISLNETLNQKLEESSQAIYKHWFIDFEYPNEKGQPYKSSGGKMVYHDELDQEIPEGWDLKNFDEHIFFQEGPGLRDWQWTTMGMKVINVKNIQSDGSVNTSNSSRYISIEEFKTRYQHFSIDEGDIIIAGSGATYGKVGKVLKHHLPIMMNTSVIRFHSKNDDTFPNSFLHIYLKTGSMKNQIESFVTGSAQPNFGPTHLIQMKILCPTQNILRKFDTIARPILRQVDICNSINLRLEKLKEILLAKMSKVETEKEVVN